MKINLNSVLRIAAASFLALASASELQATTWDFSTLSDADRAALNADTSNWKYDQSNDRWLNEKALTVSPLMANGTELQLTAGLRYTAAAADQIRVDNKKHSVTLNNKSASVTLPGLKAGDKVTVSAQSSSSSTARSLTPTNLTVVSGFIDSTDKLDNVGIVTADGDVTLTPNGGFYVYSITVDSESGDNPDTPGPVSDHSVNMNLDAHQMLLTVSGGDVKYYNTASLGSVDFDKTTGTLSVSNGDWTDTYLANVNNISFAKAQATGGEGDVVNSGITITEAKGWVESVYAKWLLVEGATRYEAYIKGGDYADWTQVAPELLRNYGTYGRVDVPGLPAGTYSLRIVAPQLSDCRAEALNMTVKAHDRSGFAFKDYEQGVGAYDMNGRLKKDAIVLYVSGKNAKTITCDIQVGTKNGAPQYETKTGLQDIIYGLQKGAETRPLCIRIIGTIFSDDMDRFDSKEEGLQVKGKNSYSTLNLTIEGIGDDAAVHGFGFLVRNCTSVEIANLGILWCLDDALSLDTDNSHVWAHHLDLFYGRPGSASDQVKGDGTLDVKSDSKYITFAYNHLWDNGKSSLCGMKSESGPNYIDYHHNWFDHSDSRHPRVRTMTVHVWNNYYDGVSKYGAGATCGASIFMENNFFRHSKNPMLISKQGTDAKGSGTFSGEDGGVIKSFGNVYSEKGGSQYTPIDQTTSANDFDCYEASSRDEQVPATFVAKAGATPYDNFDTDPALIHTYSVIPAAEVPSAVTGYYGAGRLGKGDFKWEFNNATEDTNYDIITGLQTAIKNYKSALVGWFE
ncbi:MAG: pectate lyase [Duncaniella sp.]|nr:pectate lyase [Duncaniella sp.]